MGIGIFLAGIMLIVGFLAYRIRQSQSVPRSLPKFLVYLLQLFDKR